MDNVIIIVAIGAAVAGFVQGLSGFAFGLTAMSFWIWALDPKIAAVLTVFGALTGQIIAAIKVRRGFNMRQLLPFLLGGLIGIPLGVAVLPILDLQLFKAFLGLFLVLWCPAMLFASHLPKIQVGGRLADGIIGGIGGFMGGIGGFTGIIPTLWCTLRGFEKDEQRAIIQNFNLSALTVTMVIYVFKGIVTQEVRSLFAVVAPAMLIPTLLGTRLYTGISEASFKRIVLSLLTVSGIALISTSVPALLHRWG